MARHARAPHRDVRRPCSASRSTYYAAVPRQGLLLLRRLRCQGLGRLHLGRGKGRRGAQRSPGTGSGPIGSESSIVSHHAASEAAVVAIPDAIKGEIPIAFVILKQGFNAVGGAPRGGQEVGEGRIQPHRRTLAVFFVSKLPKTRSGKIMQKAPQGRGRGQATRDISDTRGQDLCQRSQTRLPKPRRTLNGPNNVGCSSSLSHLNNQR